MSLDFYSTAFKRMLKCITDRLMDLFIYLFLPRKIGNFIKIVRRGGEIRQGWKCSALLRKGKIKVSFKRRASCSESERWKGWKESILLCTGYSFICFCLFLLLFFVFFLVLNENTHSSFYLHGSVWEMIHNPSRSGSTTEPDISFFNLPFNFNLGTVKAEPLCVGAELKTNVQ